MLSTSKQRLLHCMLPGWPVAAACASVLLLQPNPSVAQSVTVSKAPATVHAAKDLGAIDPNADMRVTVWLKPADSEAFDKAVQDIYTPGSARYQQWMTPEEVAQYAPKSSDVAAIRDHLRSQGLTVVPGDDPYAIQAHGPASQVQYAFNTTIHNFKFADGKVFRANVGDATLTGPSATAVQSVSGLADKPLRPMLSLPKDPATGQPRTGISLSTVAASGGLGSTFTNDCFQPPATTTFSGGGVSAVFTGNQYTAFPICAYTVAQIQGAYGLLSAYYQGLDGQGQTIVIVDAYGSATLEADANAFNALMGLPALDSSNLTVLYPSGQPFDPSLGPILQWDIETSLDVEWAHAMAPKAKIVLLVAASQDWGDFQAAVAYAAKHNLGSVVSNSYGTAELLMGPSELDAFNTVTKRAAAQGIAVNFSSGDSGDFTAGISGIPQASAAFPADLPYVTAVGGTSLGIPNASGGFSEVGWGNNTDLIDASPPIIEGFAFGGGGGASVYFAKPAYQSGLTGNYRQVPDVAAVADPDTGAILVYRGLVGVVGGTSLASPVFSAIWALANQNAHQHLGQAAPIIAKMSPSEINDIVPVSSPGNVTGSLTTASGTTDYSALTLAGFSGSFLGGPSYNPTEFVSAVQFNPLVPEFGVVLTFGTDTSLTTAPGWDNVTGWGTPNGLPFIQGAAAIAKKGH
jgi:subtilase family serine protease